MICSVVVVLGWLEPLLDRIARDSTTVVCRVIDVISDDTFQIHFSKARSVQVGGFHWGLIVRLLVDYLIISLKATNLYTQK